MTLSFSISGTSEQQHVFAGGGELGQLIEGVGRSLGSMNSCLCSLGEFKSANSESLWNVKQSNVVGDSAYDSNDAVVVFGFSLGYCCFVVIEMFGDA
jgi:hypothetical protein